VLKSVIYQHNVCDMLFSMSETCGQFLRHSITAVNLVSFRQLDKWVTAEIN